MSNGATNRQNNIYVQEQVKYFPMKIITILRHSLIGSYSQLYKLHKKVSVINVNQSKIQVKIGMHINNLIWNIMRKSEIWME